MTTDLYRVLDKLRAAWLANRADITGRCLRGDESLSPIAYWLDRLGEAMAERPSIVDPTYPTQAVLECTAAEDGPLDCACADCRRWEARGEAHSAGETDEVLYGFDLPQVAEDADRRESTVTCALCGCDWCCAAGTVVPTASMLEIEQNSIRFRDDPAYRRELALELGEQELVTLPTTVERDGVEWDAERLWICSCPLCGGEFSTEIVVPLNPRQGERV